MQNKLNITTLIITLVIIVIINSCANVVAPTGGPTDEDPPVVLRSVPLNFSTQYQGQDVRIFFDEYVTLKNLNQNLLISPPMGELPDVRVRRRSIIISLNDTLQPNTTYNFFFGESVVDITEGNAIPNFQFVVSTGDFVDSLSVRGNLKNAFTLQPEESVFVMMYDSIFDSVPMLQRPVYLTKTDKEGNFVINNMREGKYLMFALKDLNSNFLYDNPEEKIAFFDSLISPVYHGFVKPDTLMHFQNFADSIVHEFHNDLDVDSSILIDSIVKAGSMLTDSLYKEHLATFPFYPLFLFQEEDTVQRVVSTTMVARGKLNIVFRIPSTNVEIREYEDPFDVEWYIPEFNTRKDTLSLWLPKVTRDTLRLEISDRNRIIDSVTVSLVRRPERTRTTGRGQAAVVDTLVNISAPSLAGRNVHPYFKPFDLISQTPIKNFDPALFSFFQNDTIPIETNFEFVDSLRRTIRMQYTPEPDSSYVLKIVPGAFTDVFDTQNDSLRFAFKVNTDASYGSIILNLELPDIPEPKLPTEEINMSESSQPSDVGIDIVKDTLNREDTIDLSEEIDSNDESVETTYPIELNEEKETDKESSIMAKQYILQLMDDKLEKIIDEKIITESGAYRFNHLPAANFMFRIILDENQNGKWDTGNYLKRKQPERVFVNPEKTQTRLNWEIEVIWVVNFQ